MHGSVARVVIILHDGRVLVATGALPIGMATLIRNDLRYWLHGSRSLDVLDAHEQVQILRADSIASIEVATPEELE